jgi:hypothetical protein
MDPKRWRTEMPDDRGHCEAAEEPDRRLHAAAAHRAVRINTGTDYVAARLHVDAALLDRLTFVPIPVASGRAKDGETLFTIEMVRFGTDIAVRGLTRDIRDRDEISPWQLMELDQHLLNLTWQSSSRSGDDGYLNVNDGGTPLVIGGRREQRPLLYMVVTVDSAAPRLIVIEH